MDLKHYIIFLAVLVASASAESCSLAKPMKNLNHIKLLGKWSVINTKTPFELERTSRCVAVTFLSDKELDLFADMTGNDSRVDFTGQFTPSKHEPGVLTLRWKENMDVEARFVKADYDDYALAVGCQLGDKRNIPTYIMIFSRTTTMPDHTLRMLKKTLTNIGIDITGLAAVDQNGC